MHRSVILAVVASLAVAPRASAFQAQPVHFDQTPPAPADPKAFGTEVAAAYDRIRRATAPFDKLDAAIAAGYAASVAMCYEDSTHGAMGYHHTNPALMDKQVDLDHPEILIYERRADGSYHMVGVEFIIPYRDWPADSMAPTLLGQTMLRSDPLKIWYRHMWVWKSNPAGLFANWHPDVACRKPPA